MKKILILLISFLLVGCSLNKQEHEDYKEINNINETLEASKDMQNSIDQLSQTGDSKQLTLYLFYSSSCMHCHNEIEWLDSIKDKYKNLTIIKYEASENFAFYEEVVEKMKINDYHVPLTIVGNDYLIGYADSKSDDILSLIDRYSKFESCDVVKTIQNHGDLAKCQEKNKGGTND